MSAVEVQIFQLLAGNGKSGVVRGCYPAPLHGGSCTTSEIECRESRKYPMGEGGTTSSIHPHIPPSVFLKARLNLTEEPISYRSRIGPLQFECG